MSAYKIPDYAFPHFVHKMRLLEKKAARLGSCAVAFKVVGTEEHKEKRLTPTGESVETGRMLLFKIVEVTGTAPKLEGWSFVAVVENIGEGNIVRVLPGATLPEKFRTMAPTCEHCNAPRLRKNYYVVGNEAGEYKMVGSSCLKDFLGHASPEAAAAAAMFMSKISGTAEEFERGGGVYNPHDLVNLPKFTAYVAAAIRLYGWVSKGAAEGRGEASAATVHRAEAAMFPGRGMTREFEITPADEAEAAAAIDWAKKLESAAGTDFEWNMTTIAKNEALPARSLGTAAAMVASYQRATGREAVRAAAAAASSHYGAPGDKVELALTVASERRFEGTYGVTAIYEMVDAGGNVFKWFTAPKLERGMTYKIKGTIKGHGEYRGIAETVLTRCKAEKMEATA